MGKVCTFLKRAVVARFKARSHEARHEFGNGRESMTEES